MHLFAGFLLLFYTIGGTNNQQKPPGETGDKEGKIAKGKVLYETFACHSCHGKKGEIEGDFSNLNLRYTESELKAYIQNPRLYDNKQMPVYEGVINETDLNDLILYLYHLGEGLSD
ncbi:MAG: cytochrome c [Cryomorphaceae bacterium]|nr:cytochrome c [Cryomorphaceae bacterium]